MNDHLVRAVARDANLRGFACITTGTVDAVCRVQETRPTAAAALGRALTAAVLMGATLKGDQRTALKFQGNGPLKKVLAEADANGDVRGLVGDPSVDLPLKNGNFDVAGALGKAGLLTVIKDLNLKEPYQGVVQLAASEIGEDLAFYFADSEQIPSAVGLGLHLDPETGVAAAGGFLIQSLPPSDEAATAGLEERIRGLGPLSARILEGMTPEEMLRRIFGDLGTDVLETRPVRFHCGCTRSRLERALVALGSAELTSLIDEQAVTSITCEYCRVRYDFSRDDLKALRHQAGPSQGEPGRA